MHFLALGTDLCSFSVWWSAISAGDISAPWLGLSLYMSRRSLDEKQCGAIPVAGECIIIFKMAMRSHAKVLFPSSSLLNDPSKQGFSGRQILINVQISPSAFLAVLALG